MTYVCPSVISSCKDKNKNNFKSKNENIISNCVTLEKQINPTNDSKLSSNYSKSNFSEMLKTRLLAQKNHDHL